MDRIIDYVSVRDNCKVRSETLTSRNDFPGMSLQEYWDYWGNELYRQWIYKGKKYEANFFKLGFTVDYFLADETGFLVFLEVYRTTEAKILNGDLSVRCIMHPTFNVRKFSDERLEEVKKANLSLYGHWTPTPHFKQQVRANRKRTDGIIEIDGNDGIADCMYFFDAQTGALVSAEPYTWTD